MERRREVFINAPAQEKADLFKTHLAMQFVKRPALTQEQKSVIVDAILMTTPDTYDTSKDRAVAKQGAMLLQQKAISVFPRQEVLEIFASIGGDDTDAQLLQKYQEVTASQYRVERRAAFGALSPQEKSSIMKSHLALEMATRPLNKEQLNFIVEAISLASSETYSAAKETAEWKTIHEALNALSDRMLNFFQKEDAFEIFISLGGKDGQSEDTRNNAPLCSCAGSSDYCGWWRSGASCGAASCRITSGGCGTLLGSDCDGGCYR